MPTNSESGRGRTDVPRSSRWAVILLGGFAVAIGCPGCGPPQIKPAHRDLILRLATATSNSDLTQLDRIDEEIEQLRSGGHLDGDEEVEFLGIIALARAGDWEKARRRAYTLRDAQRPTEEDLERLKTRPLPEPRTLSKGVPQG